MIIYITSESPKKKGVFFKKVIVNFGVYSPSLGNNLDSLLPTPVSCLSNKRADRLLLLVIYLTYNVLSLVL
jgi:hypothetical protein